MPDRNSVEFQNSRGGNPGCSHNCSSGYTRHNLHILYRYRLLRWYGRSDYRFDFFLAFFRLYFLLSLQERTGNPFLHRRALRVGDICSQDKQDRSMEDQ